MTTVLPLVLLACCSTEEAPPEPVVVEVATGDEDPLPPPPSETLTPDEAQTAFVQQAAPSGSASRLPASTQTADPHAPPRAPGLESALAHYRALHALSFSQAQEASIQQATQSLMQTIQLGVDETQLVDRACDGAAAIAECTTIRADARDLLADRVRAMTMPLPLDIETQIQSTTPDIQAEIRSEVATRIRELMEAKAAEIFCQAAALYQQAGTPRAQEQLRRYGSLDC